MKLGFTFTRLINARIESVFRLFSDLDGMEDRITGIERLAKLTDGPVGVGTRFAETRVMLGREETQQMVFTAFDPPNRYVVECQAHGAHYVSEYLFERQEDATLVTVSFHGQPLGLMAKVMACLTFWMMKGVVRRFTERDVDDLRAILENSQEMGNARNKA